MTMKDIFVRLRGDNSDLNRALLGSAAASKVLGKNLDDADESSRRLSDSLNTSNDRATMLIQSALALGPALIPIGAQAVPIIMGLATQMTFAAGAAGTLVLAFSGIGDSLKAVNEFALDPSAANFEKMNTELDKLGPAGRDFVMYLQELRPQLQGLQDIAQEGLLPGAQEGIDHLLTLLPEVERIVGNISDTLGSAMAEGGASLAGPEWTEFFRYIENEAQPILSDMAHTMGNFIHGFANMVVAFGPMTDDFSDGFLQMSRDFEAWAAGLSESDSFQKFADYIAETGPDVADALGSLASMLLALVEAAAPVGAASLPIIEALADALSAILRSPAGPVLLGAAAGLSAVARAVALYKAANGLAIGSMLEKVSKEGGKAGAAAILADGGFRRMAAGAAILALSMTDVDDNIGFANTAMYGLIGTMISPGWGTAVGIAVGGIQDIRKAGGETTDTIREMNRLMASGSNDVGLYADQVSAAFSRIGDLAEALPTGPLDGIWQSVTNPDSIKLNFQAVTGQLDDSALAKQLDVAAQAEEAYGDLVLSLNEVARAQGEIKYGESVSDVEGLTEILTKARPAMDALGISTADLAAAARDGSIIHMADAIATWADEASTSRGRTRALADAIAGLEDPLLTTAQSADILTQALDDLLSPQMDLSAATDAWHDGLATLNDDLRKHNKSIVGQTAAARENRAVIRDRVQRMQDLLSAEGKAGASAGELSRMLRRQRQALLDAGAAAGVSKDDLKAYLRELGLTPKMVRTVIQLNTESAMASLRQARRELEALDGRTFRTIMEIHTVRTGAGGQGAGYENNAYGGMYGPTRHYAYGDVRDRHQPELAGPGLSRVWREPETQGESYIPHANDNRRPRAKAILEQTAGMFGGAVVWNAVGNMLRSQQTLVPARGGAGGGGGFEVGSLTVSGTLDTPWGPAQVKGIAHAAAVDVVNKHQKSGRSARGMMGKIQ